MSSLRAPGLGPIVGHTTDTTARLWIRAEKEQDEGAKLTSHRRTVGVIALTSEGGRAPRRRDRKLYYFRLRREYDRTGTFTLGEETGLSGKGDPVPLKPDTRYEARLGTLTVDDPNPDDESLSNKALADRLPDLEVWWDELHALPAARSLASFTTFPEENATIPQLGFVVGSCRYPGLLWKAKQSDAIFGPLRTEAAGRDGRPPSRFVLMVGDQIYADMLNRHVPIGLADTFEEFQERYHTAFGSLHMRALLRSTPTYMILDDHEISDNWHQDRIEKAEYRRIFNLAINAYQSYQWVHGPTMYGNRLYYSFACGGFPFFVLDTRTQRFIDDVEGSLDDNHLLGRPALPDEEPSQLEVLRAWLREQQDTRGDVPKFVVTSSVFAPSPMSAREGREGSPEQKVKWQDASDSWPAFPRTRKALLQTIVGHGDHGIQNVVFLSGDIHCSNVAQIRFAGSAKAEKLRCASITSSAFYWPFPFADGDPSGYVHDSTHPEQRDTFEIDDDHRMDYRAWNFTQEDNFCRVDVERETHRIVVRPYDTKGELITKGSWFGGDVRELVGELELAPW